MKAHYRNLDRLTERHSKELMGGVRVFCYRTKRSFVPEAIIEEIARRAGLGSAGAVRQTMVASSYWDDEGVHHFSWAY